jgi:hypothetical protein
VEIGVTQYCVIVCKQAKKIDATAIPDHFTPLKMSLDEQTRTARLRE